MKQEKTEMKEYTFRLNTAREKCTLPVYEIEVSGKEGTAVLGKILAGLSCRLIDSICTAKGASALAAMELPAEGEELTALLKKDYPKLTVSVTTATAREMLTKEVSDRIIGLLAALPAAKSRTVGTSLMELSVSCEAEFGEQAKNLARRYAAEITQIE